MHGFNINLARELNMCCEAHKKSGNAYNLVRRVGPKRFGAVAMVDFTGQLCWLSAALRSILSLAATHLVKHITTDSCVARLFHFCQHFPACCFYLYSEAVCIFSVFSHTEQVSPLTLLWQSRWC